MLSIQFSYAFSFIRQHEYVYHSKSKSSTSIILIVSIRVFEFASISQAFQTFRVENQHARSTSLSVNFISNQHARIIVIWDFRLCIDISWSDIICIIRLDIDHASNHKEFFQEIVATEQNLYDKWKIHEYKR
jgi:hypothetical protein